MSEITVSWVPRAQGFDSFIASLREIIGVSLGGTEKVTPTGNPTIDIVATVGESDNPSSLPYRISLSNYSLGTPITSYGCIYRVVVKNMPHYLIIRRKESTSYVDLIHGTYRDSQLFFMLQEIPNVERERLLTYSFEELWQDMHLTQDTGNAFEHGANRFARIRPFLDRLFDLVPSLDADGKRLNLFPKGRLNWEEKETPFECAKREFFEETNGLKLNEDRAHLVTDAPFTETFLGSNSKNYRTDYYLFTSELEKLPELTPFKCVDTAIRTQSTGENFSPQWIPLDVALSTLRPERAELIRHAETLVKNR